MIAVKVVRSISDSTMGSSTPPADSAKDGDENMTPKYWQREALQRGNHNNGRRITITSERRRGANSAHRTLNNILLRAYAII